MKFKISRLINPALFTITTEFSKDIIKLGVSLDDVFINTIDYFKNLSYADLIYLMLNMIEYDKDYKKFLDLIHDIKSNNIDSYGDYSLEEYSIFENLDINDHYQISEKLKSIIDNLYLSVDNDEERLIKIIQNTVLSIEYCSNIKDESSISSRYEPFECFTYLKITQLGSFKSMKMEVEEETFGNGEIKFLVSDYYKEVILKITNIISSIEKSDFYLFRNIIMEFDEEIDIAYEKYNDERNDINHYNHCKFIDLIKKYDLDFIYNFFNVDLDFEELDLYNTIFFDYSHLIIDIYNHIHDNYFRE